MAYLLTYFPSTVVSITLMVSLGTGCVVGSAFFYSILLPKMNVKAILAGYVSGMIPIIVSLVGLFNFPRPDDRVNSTIRDVSECGSMFEEGCSIPH